MTLKEYLKLQGLSNSTIYNYEKRIGYFLKEVTDVNQENIDKYFLKLHEKYSNKTINCYKTAIQTYLNYKDLNLKLPKTLKEIIKNPDSITHKQFEDILPVIDEEFQNPSKVKAIFYLLFYSGLRPNELVSLKRKDFDLENFQGKVYRSKISTYDTFFYSQKARGFIKLYFLKEMEKKNAFNISCRGIGKMCEKIKSYFPDFNLRPYLFRHASATRLLKEGFSIIDIQKHLGHKNLNSTQRYLNFDKEEFKKKYLERIK